MIMVAALFSVLLILQLKAATALDPCVDYQTIWMGYGYRSSQFNSYSTGISICDRDLDKAAWYRFEFDAGIILIETPVSPWFCGTQSPIWMNGSHPTDEREVTRRVCATEPDDDCWWTGDILIRLCNQPPDPFYVYKLAIPEGCALAYCVDAATQKQCQPPLVWIQDEFRCGDNATKPLTTTPEPTTPPNTDRPTSTPQPSDWSSWGSWSSCSKPCDYGIQSRKRQCQNLPCDGDSSEKQLCNTYNCEEREEEKTEGIIVEFWSPQSTMLTFVEYERRVNELMRQSINHICSADASLCCGANLDRAPPNGIDFVTSSDIYTPMGYPKENSAVIVDDKVIAVVNSDTDHNICQGNSGRISKRQSEPAGKKYISFEVMAMAITNCSSQIYQETGLTVNFYKDPATIQENEDCPTTTCVIPVTICCVFGVVGIVCLAVTIIRCSNKVNKVQSPRPPSYCNSFREEVRGSNNPAYNIYAAMADSSQEKLPPGYEEPIFY